MRIMTSRLLPRARGAVALRLATAFTLLAVVITAPRSVAAHSVAAHGPWVLGVSNTLVGNGWREEMICSVKAQALASGKVSSVKVANRNGGAAEQNADPRNLISSGANASVVHPSSSSALTSALAAAASAGPQG